MKRIRKGEYTLAMISVMGFDPVTGRSYEECHDEWRRELRRVEAETEAARWWQIRRQIRIRWQTFVLAERFGVPPGFLGV